MSEKRDVLERVESLLGIQEPGEIVTGTGASEGGRETIITGADERGGGGVAVGVLSDLDFRWPPVRALLTMAVPLLRELRDEVSALRRLTVAQQKTPAPPPSAVPAGYVCAGCGVQHVRLWIAYDGESNGLLCTPCTIVEQRVIFQVSTPHRLGARVPAVPRWSSAGYCGLHATGVASETWWHQRPLWP